MRLEESGIPLIMFTQADVWLLAGCCVQAVLCGAGAACSHWFLDESEAGRHLEGNAKTGSQSSGGGLSSRQLCLETCRGPIPAGRNDWHGESQPRSEVPDECNLEEEDGLMAAENVASRQESQCRKPQASQCERLKVT